MPVPVPVPVPMPARLCPNPPRRPVPAVVVGLLIGPVDGSTVDGVAAAFFVVVVFFLTPGFASLISAFFLKSSARGPAVMCRPGEISWPVKLKAALPAEDASVKIMIAPWWSGRRVICSIVPWGEQRAWRRVVLIVSGMLVMAIVRAVRSDWVWVESGESASPLGAGEADLWLALARCAVLECLPMFGIAMETVIIRELNLVSVRARDASASSCCHMLARVMLRLVGLTFEENVTYAKPLLPPS